MIFLKNLSSIVIITYCRNIFYLRCTCIKSSAKLCISLVSSWRTMNHGYYGLDWFMSLNSWRAKPQIRTEGPHLAKLCAPTSLIYLLWWLECSRHYPQVYYNLFCALYETWTMQCFGSGVVYVRNSLSTILLPSHSIKRLLHNLSWERLKIATWSLNLV